MWITRRNEEEKEADDRDNARGWWMSFRVVYPPTRRCGLTSSGQQNMQTKPSSSSTLIANYNDVPLFFSRDPKRLPRSLPVPRCRSAVDCSQIPEAGMWSVRKAFANTRPIRWATARQSRDGLAGAVPLILWPWQTPWLTLSSVRAPLWNWGHRPRSGTDFIDAAASKTR